MKRSEQDVDRGATSPQPPVGSRSPDGACASSSEPCAPSEPAAPDPTLELLRLAIAGDQDAWAKLYAEHELLMRRILRNRIPPPLRRRFDTEDLMQSAFLELSRRGPGLELADASSFRGWLVRVLLNNLCDRIRADSISPEQPGRPNTAFLEQQPDLRESLDQLALKAELQARMFERILGLDAVDRDIVLLRSIDQGGWAEIAEHTGLAQSTVSKRYKELVASLSRQFG